MQFALDKNDNRVNIKDSMSSESYYCPCCGSKMVLRMGDVRIHHFAHPSNCICKDTWHYDMTEWHYDWQNRFPKEYQEIVKIKDGQKHRADVLIEEEKLVFEFQHSPLSPEEFEDRNSFYNDLGYKVIWIFDVEEQYENKQIENYKSDVWSWKRPKRTFDYFDCKNKQVELYLQIENIDIDLIKVTWCTDDNGLSRFATDGYHYDEESIIHMIDLVKKQNALTDCKLSDLFDKMIKLYSESHTTYYFGCPITSTHKCADSSIDVPKSQYEIIMPCMECKYECESKEEYNYVPICKKRFLDLNLDGNTMVHIEARDNNGFVSKLSYIKNGEKIVVNLPTFSCFLCKSIMVLWKENKCISAIFKNVNTGFYVKIIRDPQNQYYQYRRVYGYLSRDRFSFPKDSCEIFGAMKPEWILEWFK